MHVTYDNRFGERFNQLMTYQEFKEFRNFFSFDYSSINIIIEHGIRFFKPETIEENIHKYKPAIISTQRLLNNDCSGISNIICLNSHPLKISIIHRFGYNLEVTIRDDERFIYSGSVNMSSVISKYESHTEETVIQFETPDKCYYIIDKHFSCIWLKGKEESPSITTYYNLRSPRIKEAIKIYSTTYAKTVEEILLDHLYRDVISVIREYLDVIPDKMKERY